MHHTIANVYARVSVIIRFFSTCIYSDWNLAVFTFSFLQKLRSNYKDADNGYILLSVYRIPN